MEHFDIVAVNRRALGLFADRARALLPLAGWFALGFLVANAARWRFPDPYVFDPFDLGWLLLPEAACFGPLLALTHHRLLAPGRAFARTPGEALRKCAQSAAYAYVLVILFLIGEFAAVQAVPALVGYVAGPGMLRFYPAIVAGVAVLLLLGWVRLLFPFAALTEGVREPLVRSILLTRGKARKIVSCLLLPAAPVLIPWVALAAFAGDWLDPAGGASLRPVAIVVRSALQTAGAILFSTGLCAAYQALVACEGDAESPA